MKECNSCAKCCIKYSNGRLSATSFEIEYWEVFRPDIAEYVRDGKIWFDPKSGEDIELCPWLRVTSDESSEHFTANCAIYHDRPDDCKIYPVNLAEMVKDGCEMIEEKDLEDLNKAQKMLDKIMADSRPE